MGLYRESLLGLAAQTIFSMTLSMTSLRVLLGFAGWTLAAPMGDIGVHRCFRVLTGRATRNETHDLHEIQSEAKCGDGFGLWTSDCPDARGERSKSQVIA